MWPKRPIALIVIAAGIALWAGKNGELVRVSQWLGNLSGKPNGESSTLDSSPFSTASQTRQTPSVQSQNPISASDSDNVPNLIVETFEPDADATEFLKVLGDELRKSNSFCAGLHIELAQHQTRVEMRGQYAQLGKETNQTRIDLRIESQNDVRELSKLCDGRFLYTLQKYRDQKKLEFIDLRRIQETRFTAGLSQPNDPSSWMATGGLASLFENIAAAFRFQPPHKLHRDGLQSCTLDGVWSQGALVDLLNETVASHYLEPHIVWQKLPENIPHQVHLELVHTADFGWVPARIDFFRIADSRKLVSIGQSSDSSRLNRIASIRFSHPQSIAFDPEGFLRLNAEDIETIDNTHLYLSQVQRFEIYRQARQSSDETLMR